MLRTSYSVSAAATIEPITAEEAMEHCRVTDTNEVNYIESLISMARQFVEMQTGRALSNETRKMFANEWADSFALDRTPAAEITSLQYWPSGYGSQETVASSNYMLSADTPSKLVFKDTYEFPGLADRPDAICVTYKASATALSLGLRHCVLLLVSHLYDQRAPLNIGNIVNELPYSLKAMIDMHRIGGSIA